MNAITKEKKIEIVMNNGLYVVYVVLGSIIKRLALAICL